MAVTWYDGFETGDDDMVNDYAVLGGAIGSVQTSYSTYSWKWTNNDGTYKFLVDRNPWWEDKDDAGGWLTFHMYIDTLPGGGQTMGLCKHVDNGIIRTYTAIDENGNIGHAPEGGSFTWDSGSPLSEDIWYTVSIRYITGQRIYARISNRDSGAPVVSYSHPTQNASDFDQGIGPYNEIGYAGNGAVYFDNFVMDDASDPYTALGDDYSVGHLKPDGTGTDNDWTNDYTYVDDLPHDSTTTERSLQTSAGSFTETMEGSSALGQTVDVVKNVAVVAAARISGLGNSCSFLCRMRESGSVVESDAWGIGDAGPTSYTRYFFGPPRATSPAGSGWTTTILNTIQAGGRVTAVGGSKTRYVTAVQLVVLYTLIPGVTGVATRRAAVMF